MNTYIYIYIYIYIYRHIHTYIHMYKSHRGLWLRDWLEPEWRPRGGHLGEAVQRLCARWTTSERAPSNLPKEFQRFGLLRKFCAGVKAEIWGKG